MNARRLILLPFLISLLSAVPSHPQIETYRVKRIVDGDTLLLANGGRVRLIGLDTPEAHKSKKLHRDAERTCRDIQTIIGLGRRLLHSPNHWWTGKRSGSNPTRPMPI